MKQEVDWLSSAISKIHESHVRRIGGIEMGGSRGRFQRFAKNYDDLSVC